MTGENKYLQKSFYLKRCLVTPLIKFRIFHKFTPSYIQISATIPFYAFVVLKMNIWRNIWLSQEVAKREIYKYENIYVMVCMWTAHRSLDENETVKYNGAMEKLTVG